MGCFRCLPCSLQEHQPATQVTTNHIVRHWQRLSLQPTVHTLAFHNQWVRSTRQSILSCFLLVETLRMHAWLCHQALPPSPTSSWPLCSCPNACLFLQIRGSCHAPYKASPCCAARRATSFSRPKADGKISPAFPCPRTSHCQQT